jgi:hypothetical protein
MLSKQEFNNTLFCVGVVKNTNTEFAIKVGLTKELCDSSAGLKFTKPSPGLDFYKTIGTFQGIIHEKLKTNNYQNLGTDNNQDSIMYYVNHRFTLFLPRIPVTRLP